ncbi:hypothetical protein HanIR_Chr02g0060931 [Helianthus annuus]|nr:hypothetical protein HanIR_Chr02g0060931 [Helianthus annuus]
MNSLFRFRSSSLPILFAFEELLLSEDSSSGYPHYKLLCTSSLCCLGDHMTPLCFSHCVANFL